MKRSNEAIVDYWCNGFHGNLYHPTALTMFSASFSAGATLEVLLHASKYFTHIPKLGRLSLSLDMSISPRFINTGITHHLIISI